MYRILSKSDQTLSTVTHRSTVHNSEITKKCLLVKVHVFSDVCKWVRPTPQLVPKHVLRNFSVEFQMHEKIYDFKTNTIDEKTCFLTFVPHHLQYGFVKSDCKLVTFCDVFSQPLVPQNTVNRSFRFSLMHQTLQQKRRFLAHFGSNVGPFQNRKTPKTRNFAKHV